MRWLVLSSVVMLSGLCWSQQQQPAKPCQDAAGKTVACDDPKAKKDDPQTPQQVKQAFPFPEDESRKAAEGKDTPQEPKPEADAAEGKNTPRAPKSEADAPSAQKPVTPADAKKSFPFPGEDAPPANDPAGNSSSSSSSGSSSSSPNGDKPSDESKAAEDEDAGPATPTGVKLKDLGSRGEITKKQTPEQRFDEDLRVADFYRKDGNIQGAYNRYIDALDQFADDPDAHLGAAEMALKLGKKDEARQHFEAVLKADAEPKTKKAAEKALASLK
ncbi:MAG: tetratricopeptide repeat protein [Acidobacteriaceae bacterium]|nr:tetratricopeptide repeat protein [Acidobacteriaceae bacterium]